MNKHYIRDSWNGDDPIEAVNNDEDFPKGISPRRFAAICLAVLGVIICAMCAPTVHAADTCPKIDDYSAHVCWNVTTQMIDGSTIPSSTVVTYTVYSGSNGTVGASPIATTTALELVFSNLTKGEHCYAVTASIPGFPPSLLSNVSCKTIRDPGPTDGSIVPSL
jgi:hypothetical protein